MEGEAEAWREESAPGAPAVGGEEAAATAAAAAAEGGLMSRLEGGRVGKGINPPVIVLRREEEEEEGARVGVVLVLQLSIMVEVEKVLSGTTGEDEESE